MDEALLREVLARVKAPFEVVTLYVPSYGHEATVMVRGHRFTVSVGFVDQSEGWLLFVEGSRALAPVPDVDETRDLLRQQVLRGAPAAQRWTAEYHAERAASSGRLARSAVSKTGPFAVRFVPIGNSSFHPDG